MYTKSRLRMTTSRRRFLKISAGAILTGTGMRTAKGQSAPAPKALLFDTFGTVVDWRGSIIAEGNAWGKSKGISVDWGRFADRWRAGYAPAMDKVRKGEMPWTNLDALHRMLLEDVLKEFGMTGLTEEEKDRWNRVWHRLNPWPDSVAGLARLKKKFIIGPLSNGNVALLTEMAKHAGLPWDVILGAELARHYKPDREAYLTSVALLELKPEETMMCAAHRGDLSAARNLGMRTGFIHRPDEYGPVKRGDTANPGDFDIVAADMVDLASKLEA
jgi:2-haloacid dehalogenase